MLIVIDSSCTWCPRPPSWPICSGPEKPLNTGNNGIPQTCETLPYWNYGRPRGAKLTLYLCKDCVVISAALTVRYSLYVKDCGIHLLPICHPCPLFSTPPFIYPSIHLSIHQFISPLFHMWIHLSWPRCCLRSYIDISAKRPQFSNWLKYTILYGGMGAGEISGYGGIFFIFLSMGDFNFVHYTDLNRMESNLSP